MKKKDLRLALHALRELTSNKIIDPNAYGGHYYGNKEQYIAQHIKTIEWLEKLISEVQK